MWKNNYVFRGSPGPAFYSAEANLFQQREIHCFL